MTQAENLIALYEDNGGQLYIVIGDDADSMLCGFERVAGGRFIEDATALLADPDEWRRSGWSVEAYPIAVDLPSVQLVATYDGETLVLNAGSVGELRCGATARRYVFGGSVGAVELT